MTERPEGTPEELPSEPEAAPEAESVTVAPGSPDAEESEAETEEVEAEDAEADDAEAEADELDDAETDDAATPLGDEPALLPTRAAAASVPRRRGVPAPVVQRAPTQSELAVRVTDNASRLFVIGTVVVYVAILGFALVGGNGGFLTTTPAPTAAPSVSAEPSASSAVSPSAAPSASVEPSASPS